jgi:hypothetical protein
MGLVTEFALEGNCARLRFHDGERVLMQIGEIGEVKAALNGKSLAGPIVVARVSAGGDAWFVLYADGKLDRKGELT